MSEKKYIDRIYQEKFRDFEATPNEAVWRSISAKLQEKEQKRRLVLPFWSRMAGVAAVLAFIFLVGDWIFPLSSGNRVVEQETEQNLDRNISPSPTQIALSTEDELQEQEEPLKRASKLITQPDLFQKRKVEKIEGVKKGISETLPEIAASDKIEKPSTPKKNNKRSLLEELEKEETVVVAEKPSRLFEVSTHAAPIYYGNLGNGNFLDPRFKDNKNQGEITYSYGIKIAYIVSDKVKIRSGVNKVNMTYNTSGIAYQEVTGPDPIAGAALSKTVGSPGPRVMGDSPRSGEPRSLANNSPLTTLGSLSSGKLNQEMGFIEVPVEIEYNLLEGKIELNIIGGASTLFLDENRISLNTAEFSAVGKATNLNDVSFSTNFGLGLDYNLSEKFKLNLEPMLKYQINTFNEASGDSHPYYLGIYSGFSYKF